MAYMNRVNDIVEKLAPELKALATAIYQNPELGLEEIKACRWQTEILEKHGFTVKTPFAGYATAYCAVYKGKKAGPKIAMLAEYDALPELGHGCGHNLIAMVGVGSGIAMKDFADEFGGELYVIGTPAEESLGTKVQMSQQGVFDQMDVVMMSHPAACNLDCGNTMAINAYAVSFYGKTAHAAAAPEEGRNALDAMINFFNMINALRQQTKEDARIHGIITKGGEAPNIIPDYAESLFYVRANTSAYLEELCQKVEDCAKGAAIGARVTYKMEFAQGNFKNTHSNLTLAKINADQMEKLGAAMVRTDGAYIPGSSDLGDVSYCCPAIQSTFDITQGGQYAQHTIEFAEAAGTEAAMDAGLLAVRGFVLTAIELMNNPEHLKQIKEEFHQDR